MMSNQTYIDQHYLRKSTRSKLYFDQGGRCCYCETPMWEPVKGLHKQQSVKPFGMLYGIPYHQSKTLLCTIEHLVGRKDGGADHIDNYAAACHYCNSKRFGIDEHINPEDYKVLVIKHMKRDTWFDFSVHATFEYTYSPTWLDKQVGKIIRCDRYVRKRIKKMENKFRKNYPKAMTKLQFVQCQIRSLMT